MKKALSNWVFTAIYTHQEWNRVSVSFSSSVPGVRLCAVTRTGSGERCRCSAAAPSSARCEAQLQQAAHAPQRRARGCWHQVRECRMGMGYRSGVPEWGAGAGTGVEYGNGVQEWGTGAGMGAGYGHGVRVSQGVPQGHVSQRGDGCHTREQRVRGGQGHTCWVSSG